VYKYRAESLLLDRYFENTRLNEKQLMFLFADTSDRIRNILIEHESKIYSQSKL